MELEIHYFPQTDTLYVGRADIANNGYDVAENLIAHVKNDGEVVGITLEHASETLAPHLGEQLQRATVSRDEGKPI